MLYEDNMILSDSASPTTPNQQSSSSTQSGTSNCNTESNVGSVAVLWDMENCQVPSDVRPEDVAGNIRLALRMHPNVNGAVTLFSAYGDFNSFPRRLREGCQRTGVKLVDVPSGRKDAADKAILVDMFLFALDYRPPSTIVLISGDVDFAPALHILGQRGYTIVLATPAGVGVSSALTSAGRFVWEWPSIARGEGFVPPTEVPIEEESIVYKGISISTSRSTEASWIQPGDIQGLKGQLVRLLENFEGSLPLLRVPPEYHRKFKRQLIMSEYGVSKLVNLIEKMEDALVITGKGPKKQLALRTDISAKTYDIGVCSNESSSEEKEILDGFKQEIQELLVCYSCAVPLPSFESLYTQRYKKGLDFRRFGVKGLEELMEKARDVVGITEREEQGIKMKFLFSSCIPA